MSISIGEVVSVRGVNIVVELYDESNKETLFYEGEKYNGVSMQELVLIRRGFRDIVARVEGEYLDERNQSEETGRYVRKVELKPIGYFFQGKFYEGIKTLPMIRDIAYLINEEQVKLIHGESDGDFVIGNILKEDLPVSLPWRKLFNTHIGVFGNTGSGKSNTLTSIYTKLFDVKSSVFLDKSRFLVIDFNGEYTADQISKNSGVKFVYNLDTKFANSQKFPLSSEIFWDDEILGILFKATENTQKPFLKRVINGKRENIDNPNALINYSKIIIKSALTSLSPKREFFDLMRSVIDFFEDSEISRKLSSLSWQGSYSKFVYPVNNYINGGEDDPVYNAQFRPYIDELRLVNISAFQELKLRMYLQLLSDLIGGYVQFDHIQPLLKRLESSLIDLEKVFTIGDGLIDSVLTVVSLRKTNQDIKKIVPLILAKFFYQKQKDLVINESPPSKTFHLVVDEAHNILSMQSNRESESWKDYRLELFEEIVKEGRKFGFFLTISSQRPADISPTIMSQIHNFFIHRLVNDRDLALLENSISSLDSISRSMIPYLSKGCAVITGTSFDIPMVVQFYPLSRDEQPDSGDVNLEKLWGGEGS